MKNLDLLIKLTDRDKIEFIYNAIKKAESKRNKQGFRFGAKKSQIYGIGFEDAIKWLLSKDSYLD